MFLKLSALATIALLASCASPIRPLASTPPVAKLRVNKPFSCGDGVILIKTNMPTGIYTPKYEDDKGYYYDAPQKVTGWDSFWATMNEGGLYLEKDSTTPKQIYVLRNYGIPAKLKIGVQTDITAIKK